MNKSLREQISDKERKAKRALSAIIDYIGADPKYKDYAQLISYIEAEM